MFVTWEVQQTEEVDGKEYYLHDGEWYTREIVESETVYVLSQPPAGVEVADLPAPDEIVEVEGQQYHVIEGVFYQQVQRNGSEVFIPVDAPIGAEIGSISAEAIEYEEEGDEVIYQYDRTFYMHGESETGDGEVFTVVAPPPSEELESIPDGAVQFVADGVTYYYVEFAFYTANESGSYSNQAPDPGARVAELPTGALVIDADGRQLFQLNILFFEQDGSGFLVVLGPDEELVEG